MTPSKTAHNVRQCVQCLALLYGPREAPETPVDDETVDPDVADYVRFAAEGLGEG